MSNKSTKKKCLIVTGMHRSGTSMVAGIFHKLGFEVGKMAGGDKSNELGYFENTNIMMNNHNLLKCLGPNWNTPQSLPKNWISKARDFRVNLKKLIIEEFKTDSMLIKDPRICRILPVFIDTIAELDINLKLVVCFRDPYCVYKSLKVRNGMNKENALALWKIYYDELIKSSKNLERIFVHYDSVINSPKETINKLSDFALGHMLNDIEDICNFVIKDLRHHRSQRKILDKQTADIFSYMFSRRI